MRKTKASKFAPIKVDRASLSEYFSYNLQQVCLRFLRTGISSCQNLEEVMLFFFFQQISGHLNICAYPWLQHWYSCAGNPSEMSDAKIHVTALQINSANMYWTITFSGKLYFSFDFIYFFVIVFVVITTLLAILNIYMNNDSTVNRHFVYHSIYNLFKISFLSLPLVL